MESLPRQITIYTWAVFWNWQGLFTSGLIIASVTIWLGWKERSMTRKFLLILSVVFFVLAGFKAWQDEHQVSAQARLNASGATNAWQKEVAVLNAKIHDLSESDFQPESRHLIGKQSNDGKNTALFFLVDLTNKGADSVVFGWRLHVKTSDLDMWVPGAVLKDDVTVYDPKWKRTIPQGTNSFSMKAASEAIKKGTPVHGFISFIIEGIASDRFKRAEYLLEFSDAYGKRYRFEFKSDIDSSEPNWVAPGIPFPTREKNTF